MHFFWHFFLHLSCLQVPSILSIQGQICVTCAILMGGGGQRPTESSDPTQHAKGRTGDCPGPHKETTTRRNVTQALQMHLFTFICIAFLAVSTCIPPPPPPGTWDAGTHVFSLIAAIVILLAHEKPQKTFAIGPSRGGGGGGKTMHFPKNDGGSHETSPLAVRELLSSPLGWCPLLPSHTKWTELLIKLGRGTN